MKSISILALISLLSLSLSAQEIQSTYYVATESGLNMRSADKTSAPIIAKIPFGAKVTNVTEIKELSTLEIEDIDGFKLHDIWVQATYNGETGFIYKGYLLPMKPPTPNQDLEDYLTQTYGKPDITPLKYLPWEDEKKTPCKVVKSYKRGITLHSESCNEIGGDYHQSFAGLTWNETYIMLKLIHKDLGVRYDKNRDFVLFGDDGEAGCSYSLKTEFTMVPLVTGYCGC